MKYKHLQIIIGILAIVVLVINIYYKGNILINISMVVLSIAMGIQVFTLTKKEEILGPDYIIIKGIRRNFLLLTIFLGCSGFFVIKKWWMLLIISVLLSIFFGFNWFKKNAHKKL